jgi:hypothetical protein
MGGSHKSNPLINGEYTRSPCSQKGWAVGIPTRAKNDVQMPLASEGKYKEPGVNAQRFMEKLHEVVTTWVRATEYPKVDVPKTELNFQNLTSRNRSPDLDPHKWISRTKFLKVDFQKWISRSRVLKLDF